MKTLPDAIIADMYGDSERVVLVRIIPESGDTWAELCWGTKDITVTDWESGGASKSFAGDVLAEDKLGTIKQSVDIAQGGNVAKVSGLTLRIVNPEYNGTNRFDETFASYNLENREVEIRLVFWTGSNPAWSDTLLLYKGVVKDVSYDYGIYQIKVRDAGFKRHKKIPNLVMDENTFPNLPVDNNGAAVPLIYGSPDYGQISLHNLQRQIMFKSNEQKEEYIISRNQCSNVNVDHCFLSFDGINRWAEIIPVSGILSVDYGRPTKISFPLTNIVQTYFYSQGASQGSNTNPSTLDFSNAVDNDSTNYFTLGANQKLYVKCPIPTEYAHIVDESKLELKVFLGTVSGTGKLTYYNPDWNGGAGGVSDGQAFSTTGWKTYPFGSDKSKHGRETNGNPDQNDRWTFSEIAVLEFGIEMDAASSAQIKEIYVLMHGMILRGVSFYRTLLYEGGPLMWTILRRYSQKIQNPVALFGGADGETFGSWIETGRSNGYSSGQLNRYTYIVEMLLRSELGLTSTEINLALFDEVGNTTDGDRKDWLFDSSVKDQDDSLELIKKFCKEAGLIYFQNYENKESIKALKKKTAVKTIDRTTIQEDSPAVELSPLDSLYNEFYVSYRRNSQDVYAATIFITASDHNLSSNTRSGTPNTYTGLCSDSQTKYNQIKRFELKCDWIQDDATAECLIKWLAEWLCYRKYIFPFQSVGLDHIELEMGDQIKIDHTLLPTGVSDDDNFVIFDIGHDLDDDRIKYKCMQVPDLLP